MYLTQIEKDLMTEAEDALIALIKSDTSIDLIDLENAYDLIVRAAPRRDDRDPIRYATYLFSETLSTTREIARATTVLMAIVRYLLVTNLSESSQDETITEPLIAHIS